MEKRIINISVTDTWTDEDIIEDLSKKICNYGDTNGNIGIAKITLTFERVQGDEANKSNMKRTGCGDYLLHKECLMFEIKGYKACRGCNSAT